MKPTNEEQKFEKELNRMKAAGYNPTFEGIYLDYPIFSFKTVEEADEAYNYFELTANSPILGWYYEKNNFTEFNSKFKII